MTPQEFIQEFIEENKCHICGDLFTNEIRNVGTTIRKTDYKFCKKFNHFTKLTYDYQIVYNEYTVIYSIDDTAYNKHTISIWFNDKFIIYNINYSFEDFLKIKSIDDINKILLLI